MTEEKWEQLELPFVDVPKKADPKTLDKINECWKELAERVDESFQCRVCARKFDTLGEYRDHLEMVDRRKK